MRLRGQVALLKEAGLPGRLAHTRMEAQAAGGGARAGEGGNQHGQVFMSRRHDHEIF